MLNGLNHQNKEHDKTQRETPRSKNHKATQNKTTQNEQENELSLPQAKTETRVNITNHKPRCNVENL